MPARPDEIRGRAGDLWAALERRIEDVRSVVDRIDDAGWTARCAQEGWPVALVACHITLGLRRQAGWVARALAGRPPHAFDWERTHALNALVARRADRISRTDVLSALDTAADRWRTLLATADDAGLGRPAFRYQERDRTVDWIAGVLTPRHIDEHLRSIRVTLPPSQQATNGQHGGDMTASAILPQRSVARRLNREMFLLLGGTTALLMQVAHPLVAAGVDQHSDFRVDPFGRLRRTLDTTLAVVFGDERAASAAIGRMNRIHRAVGGTASGGRAYSARDPRLLLWVQATLVLTSLRLYEQVMGPLTSDDREAYWEEAKPIAAMLGLPAAMLPLTVADLERYEDAMLASEVVPDATARSVARDVIRPLRWLPEIAYWPSDALTAALLPPSLRAAFGLRYGRPERLVFRGVVVALRALRRALPDLLTVVPQARWYERASRSRG